MAWSLGFGPSQIQASECIDYGQYLRQLGGPFRASGTGATIEFELAQSGRATLRVFDAAGRLVRVVFDEVVGAGPQAVTWDGRDQQGQPVAAGTYFYRLQAGDFVQTRMLTRVP